MFWEITTDDERAKLEELRGLAKSILPDEQWNDDMFLLRWLVARDFNVQRAFAMLQKSIEWRKMNEVKDLLKWQPSDDMRLACPYEICGKDNENSPILYFPYGKWTPWIFTDNGRRDEYINYVIQMLENCLAAIEPPSTQFVIIADSDGFGLRQMKYIRALEANLEILKQFEGNYPEYMKSAYAINCPKMFSVLFAILKPLMSTYTQSKLSVYGCNENEWKSALAETIQDDQLPEKFRVMGSELH